MYLKGRSVDYNSSVRPKGKPVSPGAAAILTFGGLVFGVGLLCAFLFKDDDIKMIRMEKVGEGSASLGIIIAVGVYFAQRNRVRAWETRHAAEELREKREAIEERRAGRTPCKRCGVVLTGSDQPWQKASYCSEKCMNLHAKG